MAAAPATLPADAEEQIKSILSQKDLTQTSLKEVRAELERHYGVAAGGFDGFREEIKAFTSKEIARLQDEAPEEPAEPNSVEPEQLAAASASSAAEGKKRGRAKESRQSDQTDAAANGGKGRSKGPGTKEKQKSLMTKTTFKESAEPFAVQIGNKKVKVDTKMFSTGSCGWWGASKVNMDVDGRDVLVQCQVSCTIIGSKEWSES
mmetsp:Transcript_85004/g.259595  ORF Transcript_85004/g.259595 Transcript_85004/m.259595 type:complete len:205 (-) Transcript_85004:72-686(-)